jgi:hypothetical protein
MGVARICPACRGACCVAERPVEDAEDADAVMRALEPVACPRCESRGAVIVGEEPAPPPVPGPASGRRVQRCPLVVVAALVASWLAAGLGLGWLCWR